MKILQINSVCGIGSTGRIVLDIMDVAKSSGNQAFAFYGRGRVSEKEDTFKMNTRSGSIIAGAHTRITDRHGFCSEKETRSLVSEIKKINPDIIHLHNIHGYYLNIDILFACLKELNKPVVWTLHDCWAFTGHCAYFDFAGCDRWKKGCYKCPQKTSYPKSFILEQSERNYRDKKRIFTSLKNVTLVTPSQWLANLVDESYLKKYQVKVINNGIDLSIFRQKANNEHEKYEIRDKYRISGSHVILGIANIWEERKGLKYLLSLAEKLNSDYCMVIVGLSGKERLNMPPNVIGISRTNNVEELAGLYSIADVYMNPTLEDNFPTTNLEALACGTPVITFDTGGSPESIDETCGLVVEKGNSDKLFEAVMSMKENPFHSEACIKRAELYDKKNKYGEYLKLYENILSHKDSYV